GDTFDFADIKPDDKTADEADFNIWQQNFGADPTSAAELNGSITWLDPSLDEELGTIELKDSGDDLII
ncbi:MAG: hypothetical protein HKN11_17775, partial [Rhizobiales bacterium]|nr:hypothetical protein [Hyphomicrobiales bacterium]